MRQVQHQQPPPAPPYGQQQRLPGATRQQHLVGYPGSGMFPSADQTQYVVGGQPNAQVLQQQPGLKPTPPPVPSPQGGVSGCTASMMMGTPGGAVGISVQQQQLMQTVRSPPPIRSPQPNPSPRPVPSPRNQPVPSPRGGGGPVPSPHHHPPPPHITPTHSPAHHQPDLGGSSEMMLSQLSGGAGGAGQPHGAGGGIPHHPSPVGTAGTGGAGQGPSDPNDVPAMTPQDKLSKFVEQL